MRELNSIQKNHKFLLNDTSTGVILHFETSRGPVPVVNSEGKKIEFYFTDNLNNKSGIDKTEYTFPHTKDPLPVIEYYDVFGTDDDGGGLADNDKYWFGQFEQTKERIGSLITTYKLVSLRLLKPTAQRLELQSNIFFMEKKARNFRL